MSKNSATQLPWSACSKVRQGRRTSMGSLGRPVPERQGPWPTLMGSPLKIHCEPSKRSRHLLVLLLSEVASDAMSTLARASIPGHSDRAWLRVPGVIVSQLQQFPRKLS